MSAERRHYRGRGHNRYVRNYNSRESQRDNNPNYGWRNTQHRSSNNQHNYNRYTRNYHPISSYSHQSPSPSIQHDTYRNKEKQLVIDQQWIKIIYDVNNNEHKTKISQIVTYGQRCRDNCSKTECLIYYGKYILHTNINGDIIGLYNGGYNVWEQWIWYYLGGNMQYDAAQIFSNKDLFGSSIICGKNLCSVEYNKIGYPLTEAICKKGWLDGLKCIIEERKINHIDEKFKLLVETAYLFNDTVLKYLMLENKFYTYFDVDTQVSEYDETLWICCRDQFAKISKPGSGWLHCLESIHYAPVLIQKIHNNNMELKDDQNENHMTENWMLKELNEIKLNVDNIKLTQQYVEERLNIIKKLINNQQVKFKLESCFYGLCVDAAGSKLHSIHFWKPHIDRNETKHSLEYIPAETEWGRLRMGVSDAHFFTVVSNKNAVKFCTIMTDDCQLWKIEQMQIKNENKIWIRVINKLGYKLIFSWKKYVSELPSSMPVLSVSDKIHEIDELCVDIFSVAKNNYSTKYRLYFEKYQYVTNRVILNGIGRTLNRHSFWRLSVDGSKVYHRKFDCYKGKVGNIANTLWQFKETYIKSLYDNHDKQQDMKPQTQQRPGPPTRSPPPPPPPKYTPLYECSALIWNGKICAAIDSVYVPQGCIENLKKYIDESFASTEALHYYLTHTIAIQIIEKQAIYITFSKTGKSICLMHTELHKKTSGFLPCLFVVIVENISISKHIKQPWKIIDSTSINEAFMTTDELFNNYGIIQTDLPVSVRRMSDNFEDLKSKIAITEQLIMDTDWKHVNIVKSNQLNAFNSNTLQINADRFRQLALQSLKEYINNKEFTSILELMSMQNKYHLRKLLPIFIPEFQKYVAISFADEKSVSNSSKTVVIAIHLNLIAMKNKARLVGHIPQDSWLHLITHNSIMNNIVIVDIDISQNNMNMNQIKKTQKAMGLHDILGNKNVYYQAHKSINDNFNYNTMNNDAINIRSLNYNSANPIDESQSIQQFINSNDIFGWLKNIVRVPQYYNTLLNEGFEDFETILEVEEADLIEMHIDTKEHRLKIISAVQQIKSNKNIKI
eukprot:126154_1